MRSGGFPRRSSRSWRWLATPRHQIWDIVRSEISILNFSNSPCMRGAPRPHLGATVRGSETLTLPAVLAGWGANSYGKRARKLLRVTRGCLPRSSFRAPRGAGKWHRYPIHAMARACRAERHKCGLTRKRTGVHSVYARVGPKPKIEIPAYTSKSWLRPERHVSGMWSSEFLMKPVSWEAPEPTSFTSTRSSNPAAQRIPASPASAAGWSADRG